MNYSNLIAFILSNWAQYSAFNILSPASLFLESDCLWFPFSFTSILLETTKVSMYFVSNKTWLVLSFKGIDLTDLCSVDLLRTEDVNIPSCYLDIYCFCQFSSVIIQVYIYFMVFHKWSLIFISYCIYYSCICYLSQIPVANLKDLCWKNSENWTWKYITWK